MGRKRHWQKGLRQAESRAAAAAGVKCSRNKRKMLAEGSFLWQSGFAVGYNHKAGESVSRGGGGVCMSAAPVS